MFVLEYHSDQEKAGRTITVANARVRALPIWATMNKQIREKYNEKSEFDPDSWHNFAEKKKLEDRERLHAEKLQQEMLDADMYQTIDTIMESDGESRHLSHFC